MKVKGFFFGLIVVEVLKFIIKGVVLEVGLVENVSNGGELGEFIMIFIEVCEFVCLLEIVKIVVKVFVVVYVWVKVILEVVLLFLNV